MLCRFSIGTFRCRGLTVFGFEIVLISGSMALAASLHGIRATAPPAIACGRSPLVTALCQLCFYYNDLYDLTVVHSNRELIVRLLQAAGAAAIVLAAACVAVPSLILDPSTFLTALGVFVIAVAHLAGGVQPFRARSAPRGARADRRHRP